MGAEIGGRVVIEKMRRRRIKRNIEKSSRGIRRVHLNKLTDAELQTYTLTGKLPLGWRLRRKR